MKTTLSLLVALIVTATTTELALKRVAYLPLVRGNPYDRLLLYDTDHDGLGEVIHNPNRRFQMAEYRPVNRYEFVLCESCRSPWPESIRLGMFRPTDVGDVDRDGLTDFVGQAYYDSGGGYTTSALCTFESRDSFSYPDSVVWWTEMAGVGAWSEPSLYANLDGDSAWDILAHWGYESTAVFENVGNDRESLVCIVPRRYGAGLAMIGDFDQNGRTDCTFAYAYVYGQDVVVECIGDNKYAQVCSVSTGVWMISDRFTGQDVDHNGRPEYFEVSVRNMGGLRYSQTLCQLEATAEHQYFCDTVDTASSIYEPYCGQSLCADVDGDSLDEIVWGCGYRVIILKPTGPHQYERVCDRQHDSLEGIFSMCNAADFNGNGYKEIFVGGNGQSFVLEVECIRVLNPDTTRYLRAGDTCAIRWQLFQPPRCDSVSLFLRTDTAIVNGFYRLDTIVTGLSPGESTYSWVVPDTTLDSARILAIAYGPGWQFDESDSAFRIAQVGMAGPRIETPRNWTLFVNPSPARGAFTVCYDVPRQGRVSVGVYDAGGRLVRSLSEGGVAPGRYETKLVPGILPAGVYFCTLVADGQRLSRKVVLTR